MNFDHLRNEFENKARAIDSLRALDELRVEYLGKAGLITAQMKQLGGLSIEKRKSVGAKLNELKTQLEEQLNELYVTLNQKEIQQKLASEKIDVSIDPRNYKKGKIHPLSQAMSELRAIWTSLGFVEATGQEIEDDWYNFTALNIPEIHPARQMHDTFYVEKQTRLLRTHTSNVQIRHMSQSKPPIKIFSIGRVYRSESDATHTPMFHQLEGIYIDKAINMGHLKSYLETFLKAFFGVDHLPIRLRPSYFPFTEPSAEVDMLCDRSNKGEIKFGTGNDWLEILGSGMVHQKVLENVGIDPDEYQGFAFGSGVERLAMLKYNIPDLRDMFEGDIRWVKHYGF